MSGQAAGRQTRRMRPLLPAPGAGPQPRPTEHRQRQANVPVACRPCREKKAKVFRFLKKDLGSVIETESAGSALARGRFAAAVP